MTIEQSEMFPVYRPLPQEIIARAVEIYRPVATFALFSGGDGSLQATHWYMNNVPDCRVAHINTGIGLHLTSTFVRETCDRHGWDLTEIRAKEDCRQDYDKIVLEYGFPGPAQHQRMYIRLKERAIEELVRRNKKFRSRQNVMLLTGIKHDDSERRSGYGNHLIKKNKAQIWVNPLYWQDASAAYHYLREHQIERSPVAQELGMSGECGCGAYADKGELRLWRRIEPEFGERIDRLQEACRFRGVHCKWEERPPKGRDDKQTADMFQPLCTHCLKKPAREAA